MTNLNVYRLAILNTHPVQYFAPFYRRLAAEPDFELNVFFCSRQGVDEYVDAGFGERIRWDTPLLDGYDSQFLPNLGGRQQVAGFWSLINPGIVRCLRQNQYDALIVNGHNHATYVLAICAAKALGIPVLMRCETHLALQRSNLKRLVRKPLMSILYNRLCAACLPIGTRNREFYMAHGVCETRLFTAPYAVDNAFFDAAIKGLPACQPLREQLGLPPHKPIILFASKLIPRKRPLDLLRAYSELTRTGVDATLVFVGSGELEDHLREYSASHGLADVYFPGFRNQTELPAYLSVADVFVLPSENEPWGLIINEAMCAGLPVIASEEVGATADLVRKGENGFTFNSGDVLDLTRCLRRILEAPELARRMGEASRRLIAQWDYEHCVDGIKDAMASIRRQPGRIAQSQAA